MPPADIAVKIAQALGVSVEYLVTGNDAKHSTGDNACLHFLIEDLKTLGGTELNIVSQMVHAIAKP